jgi:hypothetical protein
LSNAPFNFAVLVSKHHSVHTQQWSGGAISVAPYHREQVELVLGSKEGKQENHQSFLLIVS